jgi:polyisoprenoid-binding protein YceI
MVRKTAAMRRRRLLLLIPLALVVAVVGGTWVYINVIREEPPERLSLETVDAVVDASGSTTTSTTSASGAVVGVGGTWKVITDGTTAGYRVSETLFGQKAEAVGRTSKVTGSLTIAGTTVTKATYVVDMASVTSPESQRDGQFKGRIMETSTFPTSTFELTKSIELGSIPEAGKKIQVTATGNLTLHGKTREVVFPLEAVLDGSRIKVLGTIKIVFADYGISNPSGGPASVGNEGDLEVLLVFERS